MTDETTDRGARRTHRARPWIVATAAALLTVGAMTGAAFGWSAFAEAQFASMHRQSVQVSEKLGDVSSLRGAAIDKARATTKAVDGFLAAPRPAYLAAARVDALKKADDALHAASNTLAYAPYTAAPTPSRPSDLWPLTVIGELASVRASTDADYRLGRQRAAELSAMEDAEQKVRTAGTAIYHDLSTHAEATIDAATDATYESRFDLQHALSAGADAGSFSSMGLGTIIAATDAVVASEAAGEAEKQDPAYPAHAAIEAYARSIAHGINLDFQWHAVVGGYGAGWYSGTTVYHPEDGGWATIDLNFDTVDGWNRGDVDAKALITHEVGHSQVVRPDCRPLFTGPVFNSDDEMWATAWAISMGFDTAGSGIEAYGRPSDQQIATAGQCR